MHIRYGTSTSNRELVYLKGFFWVSPSILSNDFSIAAHPISIRVKYQWYGWWNFMDLQPDFVKGRHICIKRATNVIKCSLYFPTSDFFNGFRIMWWASSSIFSASPYRRFVASETSLVKQNQIRRCRAILIHHPPFMRVNLGIKYEHTPCWNVLNPSRPSISTFLQAGIFAATAMKKLSISLQT